MWIAPHHLNNVCGVVWPSNVAFQGMCLEVFDTLYTMVQRVYQKRISFGAGNRFVYFFYFSLSLSSLNFVSSSTKFHIIPFNFFYLHIWFVFFWLLFFFYFRISFIIINIFQFHPNIFQSISIKLQIFFQFRPHHFLIYK
jgi:hypothetical protein